MALDNALWSNVCAAKSSKPSGTRMLMPSIRAQGSPETIRRLVVQQRKVYAAYYVSIFYDSEYISSSPAEIASVVGQNFSKSVGFCHNSSNNLWHDWLGNHTVPLNGTNNAKAPYVLDA